MNRIIFVFCTIVFSSCYRHVHIEEEDLPNLQMHELMFSYQIDDLASHKRSYNYSYISEHTKAIQSYGIRPRWGMDSIRSDYKEKVIAAELIAPRDFARDMIDDEELIIISEAHNKPEHRVFTTMMLENLYEKGFRHLGLETLSHDPTNLENGLMDKELMRRGYPLNSPLTGFYTREPRMGDLVRIAIKMGFQLFAYERVDRTLPRDAAQAKNIAKYIKNHPKGKTIIHCGWDHAIESPVTKRKDERWMANILKEQYGFDPLTIYQDVFSDNKIDILSPYYKLIDSDQMGVLMNEDGTPLKLHEQADNFDFLVYHPPGDDKFGQTYKRYLYEEGRYGGGLNYKAFKKLEFPFLVKIFKEGESFQAVPIDIIEVTGPLCNGLVYPLGKSKTVATDTSGTMMSYKSKAILKPNNQYAILGL